MATENEVRIGFLTYLKHIFTKPTANILSNTYVFWGWNLFVVLIVMPFTLISGLFMRAPAVFEHLAGQNGDTEDLIYLAEFFLIAFLLYVIAYSLPLLMLNVSIIYLMNRIFSPSPGSLQKVLSDHTNVLVQSYVWFFLGSGSTLAGLHLNSDFLQGLAIFLFILCGVTFLLGSIGMMRFYFRRANKLKFSLIYVVSFMTVTVTYLSLVLLFFV